MKSTRRTRAKAAADDKSDDRPKKLAVRFAKKTQEIFKDEDIREHVNDVKVLSDAIVTTMNKRVGEAFVDIEYPVDSLISMYMSVYEPLFGDILARYPFPIAQSKVREILYAAWNEPSSELYRRFFQTHPDNPEHPFMEWAALTLMTANLGTFMRYGHCMNKCGEVLKYFNHKLAVGVRETDKELADLVQACKDAHREITEAMKWHNILDLDSLFQKASEILPPRRKCSIAFPNPKHIRTSKYPPTARDNISPTGFKSWIDGVPYPLYIHNKHDRKYVLRDGMFHRHPPLKFATEEPKDEHEQKGGKKPPPPPPQRRNINTAASKPNNQPKPSAKPKSKKSAK